MPGVTARPYRRPLLALSTVGSLVTMSAPVVVAVTADSPADRAGVQPGDRLLTINDRVPRDVIEYQLLVDEPSVTLVLDNGGLQREVVVDKPGGSPMGVEVDSALFDRVRTCDNHCEFCFIYQLPQGLRRSLYVKDDDYRLSFLYGNFTTLTRFTEADLERVESEGLGPLYVSIHATDPGKRTEMLRNRRGATSLRWLRALLDHGVDVHGQVVVCPGLNDGAWLEDTLVGVADRFSDLASLCVVPLGVSRYNAESRMRAHTTAEAVMVVEIVETWQERFLVAVGRRLVHAADEYHLLAGRAFPPVEAYEDIDMTEDGVGMARSFESEFYSVEERAATDPSEEWALTERSSGFFRSMEGAPALGYRAPRTCGVDVTNDVGENVVAIGVPAVRPRRDAPVGVLTGTLGAAVLRPLVSTIGRDDVRVLPVSNRFFGGNVAVTGLMVGEDIARVLADEPVGHRYLLPDVCLSGGRFLDGSSPEDLPRPVEVVAADGRSLRTALERST